MINFILGLLNQEGFNCALTVTDKFSKAVMALPGKETHASEDWVKTLLSGLTDWGIPKAIISDRDPKFLSDLWKGLFKALNTKLLVLTAYHPQTDGQSEQMNQTIEIVI